MYVLYEIDIISEYIPLEIFQNGGNSKWPPKSENIHVIRLLQICGHSDKFKWLLSAIFLYQTLRRYF